MWLLAEAMGMVHLEPWTEVATVLALLPVLSPLCEPLLITAPARPGGHGRRACILHGDLTGEERQAWGRFVPQKLR